MEDTLTMNIGGGVISKIISTIIKKKLKKTLGTSDFDVMLDRLYAKIDQNQKLSFTVTVSGHIPTEALPNLLKS